MTSAAIGQGLKIAVIDSGVNIKHPHICAITHGVVLEGVGHESFEDTTGHGTAVMAAIQENAPGAEYFAVKLFGNSLRTGSVQLMQAIAWAIEARVAIVNLSLGTPNFDFRALDRSVGQTRASSQCHLGSRAQCRPIPAGFAGQSGGRHRRRRGLDSAARPLPLCRRCFFRFRLSTLLAGRSSLSQSEWREFRGREFDRVCGACLSKSAQARFRQRSCGTAGGGFQPTMNFLSFFLLLFAAVVPAAQLPFTVEACEDAASQFPGAPRIQSFAFGQWQGRWVFIGGRIAGYHNMGGGAAEFLEKDANQDVWVVDTNVTPAKTYHAPLAQLPASLTPVKDQWSSAALLYVQDGATLYIAGGYGRDHTGKWVTFPSDLPSRSASADRRRHARPSARLRASCSHPRRWCNRLAEN